MTLTFPFMSNLPFIDKKNGLSWYPSVSLYALKSIAVSAFCFCPVDMNLLLFFH